ncbi:MAG: hypothetical protein AAGC60_24445 [Acidobacteriota bacterium]
MKSIACKMFTVLAIGLVLAASPVLANQAEEQGPGIGEPQPVLPQSVGIAGVMDDLFAGTGAFGGGFANPAFTIDVETDTSTQVFTGLPVWGAAYEAAGDRVLFTSSGVDPVDGADLYEYSVSGGGAPTLLGSITLGGTSLRIDGLAISGGVLYGVQQFDSGTSVAGLFSIDPTTREATFLVGVTSGAISGIGADADTGIIYGADDTAGQIVTIDPVGGSTNFAPYPAAETDLDGLAAGGGKIYLVPDDNTPGEIFPFDIASMTYDPSLTAPWGATADTFSGAAFLGAPEPEVPVIEIPTLSALGMLGLVLLLGLSAAFLLRRRA